MDTNCERCGSSNTRVAEITNDELGWLQVNIVCDDCQNEGTAELCPNSINWEHEMEEDEDDE